MSNNPSIEHDVETSEMAKLPMELIVTPYPEQKDDEVMMGSRYGSDKPIVVYRNVKGGLYNELAYKWKNTENGHEGYGPLELLSDISNRPMCGKDLQQMCQELAKLAKLENDRIFGALDLREQVAPQEVLTYVRKAAFTVEDLECLGCTVRIDKDGVVRYGFDCGVNREDGTPYFTPNMLYQEFKVIPLVSCTLPKVRRDGQYVSEKLISTPFNPLFICFADVDETAGCIMRPGQPDFKNIVFSKSSDFTTSKVARWLGGDAVFTQSLYQRSLNKTARNTGYLAALRKLDRKENYQHLKDMWHVKENGKQELITVTVDDSEAKADNIIFCHSMADALCAYYHLNALAVCYPNSQDYKGKTYHVCFNFGDTSFSARQYGKAHQFAHRIYTLFPNDAESVREARMIGKKYREIYRAALPDSFADVAGHCRRARVFQHDVNSVRDFFLVYKMDKEQAYANDYDINKFFLKTIVAALPSSPLKHCAKKNKDGETTDDFWQVNAATLWEFMASEGYCRVIIDKASSDKVGRFFHLDFPFFDELDRNSMVSATRQCLRNYARTVARPDSNDYEKICDTIAKSREISDKTIDGLPLQEIDYRKSYNEKLDHFYFRNCALRITPTEIKPVPYQQLDFFVDRSEVLPWDFRMPFMGNNVPFTIGENPEYLKRKKEIEDKREMKMEDGKPMYSADDLDAENAKLEEWARVYRWKFDFRGKPQRDWWAPLLVLRGFANEYWQEERNLKYQGEHLEEDKLAIVDAHLANILFSLARPLYRYHNNSSYCAPYLMENQIQAGEKAQGGSGKSTLVNTFMGCCGYVLCVDAKSLMPNKDPSFAFSEYVPKHHRVVHVEDLKEGQDLKVFYNNVMSDFKYQKKFVDVVSIPHEESPGMVFSSNFPIKDTSSSTMGRFLICGFSDRFIRANIIKGQRARTPGDIMTDFTSNPAYLNPTSRWQIAYICAVGVQFIMRYNAVVNVPTKEAIIRMEKKEYGDSFIAWQSAFFERMASKNMWGQPLDYITMFTEYMEYVNTSEKLEKSYSESKFLRKLQTYCASHGMVVNPPQILIDKDGKNTKTYQCGFFRLQAWKRFDYFVGKEWENDSTVQPKYIRKISASKVIFIYLKEDKNIPANYMDQFARYKEFIAKGIDPDPILDENGKPYALTDEEQERWKAYKDFKQGKRNSTGFSGTIPMGGTSYKPQSHLTEEEIKKSEEDLPF